jgi:phenylpropionate dioxygenase-like ring-hydroxylating dioxygenase large terminal subunit
MSHVTHHDSRPAMDPSSAGPEPAGVPYDVIDGAGVLNNVVFTAEAHDQEMRKVFGTCWIFVGHESQIPEHGDYFTSYMGEDAVIVTRDGDQSIRVLLNKCRHRGNKVCLFDRGSTKHFRCSYHAWTYNSTGALTGVPLQDEAYRGELDKAEWGLVGARVESTSGFIFATWDPQAPTLSEYLGDAKWYIDNLLGAPDFGGLQVLAGKQRYKMPCNWKLLAENFAGDHYHFTATHASFLKVLEKNAGLRTVGTSVGVRESMIRDVHEVTVGFRKGAPSGFGQLRTGSAAYESDLAVAATLGPEAVDWVKHRHERMQLRLKDVEPKPYSLNRGNIFPNFSMIGFASALEGRGLIVWNPRGSQMTETWQWCAVEKDAPEVVRQHAVNRLMRGQAAAGLISPDDHENFERLAKNTQTPLARAVPFNYKMAIGYEESDSGADYPAMTGLPGLIGPRMNEANQREFWRYWQELMSEGTETLS